MSNLTVSFRFVSLSIRPLPSAVLPLCNLPPLSCWTNSTCQLYAAHLPGFWRYSAAAQPAAAAAAAIMMRCWLEQFAAAAAPQINVCRCRSVDVIGHVFRYLCHFLSAILPPSQADGRTRFLGPFCNYSRHCKQPHIVADLRLFIASALVIVAPEGPRNFW